MYSHGSSARIGIGKRGHGGREYKPPPNRRDKGQTVPPPLKECNCLVQLDIPEYAHQGTTDVSNTSRNNINDDEDGRIAQATIASTSTPPSSTAASPSPPRRLHRSFRGGDPSRTESENLIARRTTVQDCERYVRCTYAAHLVIPGRNQVGPLAIVGQTWHEALAATEYVLRQLDWTTLVDHHNDTPPNNRRNSDSAVTTSTPSGGRVTRLNGRIQRNVKDPRDPILSGIFEVDPSTLTPVTPNVTSLQPWWLFQNSTWTVLACRLTLSAPGGESQEKSSSTSSSSSSSTTLVSTTTTNTDTTILQTCVDNMRFRLGNDCFNDLDIFICDKMVNSQAIAYAGGNPTSATILFNQILETLST